MSSFEVRLDRGQGIGPVVPPPPAAEVAAVPDPLPMARVEPGALSGLAAPAVRTDTLVTVSDAALEPLPPAAGAWEEVLTKLFSGASQEQARIVYDLELRELEEKLEVPAGSLLEAALDELAVHADEIRTNARGQIANPEEIGEAFNAIYQLANEKVEICVAASLENLYSKKFPLSREMAAILEPIVRAGETVVVMVAKEPPLRAAEELRAVAEKKFGQMMSLWQNRELWDAAGVSPALRGYLEYATVRVIATGENPELMKLARSVNIEIERTGGFEDSHWTSLVKGVTQGDRHHALKEALMVCIPVVFGVKALESFAPWLMHSVGGMLDDLFGAIIPDVSQSMGKKGLPFKERFKEAWPVLREGLTSLPVAVGLGWGAAALYGASTSVGMHALSGLMFALACSAGTVGTSIGAYRKASATIEELRSNPAVGEYIESLGTVGRMKLALQESIFDVPFRVGHTVIGVPLQIALGVAAGVGGFFHNGLFVMAEGMLETLLGAGTAFGYSGVKSALNQRSLKQLKPGQAEA